MLGQVMKRTAGITLIELMVVIALIGVVLALAAPTFKDMILMQRLRSINSELVTDMQFARSEAVARRDFARVFFKSAPDGTATCYTIYTSAANNTRCDCLAGPGAACSGTMVEIKTVKVPSSLGIQVKPQAGQPVAFAFDWRTGGLYLIPTDNVPRLLDLFVAETFIDNSRKLATQLNAAGRPLVCRPSGSTMNEAEC
ncbi:MAG: pilus assembly protein FimT [Leptothrix sp. (in: Bacteria)]|nr:pilus assembly protein FimT [Leptothrix sp. (in: b-proteobacteria)]